MSLQSIGQYGGAYHWVLAKDNHVYAVKAGGLAVIDVHDPIEPKEVGFYRTNRIVELHISGHWHRYMISVSSKP